MKLRNLNGAIRNAGDKITITLPAPDGRLIQIKVPRTAVIDGLNAAFEKEGMIETGLMIDKNGALIGDFVEMPAASEDPDTDAFLESARVVDEDDLLAGAPTAPAYDDDDLLG